MSSGTLISRRQFLKILAFSAAAGLAYGFNDLLSPGERTRMPDMVRQSHYLMDTVVNLTMVGEDAVRAREAAEATLGEMRRLVDVFSRYDASSQLSQLNNAGVLLSPHPALVTLLRQAQVVYNASAGAFDVSVKPLLDLYQTAFSQSQLPMPADIRQGLKRVGASKVVCDEGEIRLTQKGMGLTLDGIAKGAIIDAGASVLRAHGFDNVIVEAGGDLLACGAHGPAMPWKIGLHSPREGQSLALPRLGIRDRAVATSGDYLQAYRPDYSVHHILDPRRGISPSDLASVTVVAPTASLADALATAVIVSGIEDGLCLLAKFPGCDAYLIDKNLQAVASTGMEAYLIG